MRGINTKNGGWYMITNEIKERNIPKLYKDQVFKSIFKDNPNILAKMLADII